METPRRPLTSDEAAAISEAYSGAAVTLQYGINDAIWQAAMSPDKTIMLVTGDRVAAFGISEKLKSSDVQSMPLIHVADLGPVGRWAKSGKIDPQQFFRDYPLSIWGLTGLQSPDVVFVDGHCKAACFAAVCCYAKKTTRLFFRDYATTSHKEAIESLCEPTRMIGRMAEFQIQPHILPDQDLPNLFERFLPPWLESKSSTNDDESRAARISVSPDQALDVPLSDRGSEEPKRKNKSLMIGLALSTLPVSVPYLLFRSWRKSKRRRAKFLVDTPSIVKERHNGKIDRIDVPLQAAMAEQEDDFVLYRIIGNDLEPRSQYGQSRRNVQFILDHEPAFAGCTKVWLLNKIVDPAAEDEIIGLLEDYGQEYLRIPFAFSEYETIPFDFSLLPGSEFLASAGFRELSYEARLRAVVQTYRLKNNYAMNNNGARNTALEDGKARAKWILPWDGNCYLSDDGWEEIREAVLANRHHQYFTVPMARFATNEELLSHTKRPEPKDEPQLIFRRDAAERFDTAHPYGRRPKVEFLARLGVEGIWNAWQMDPWDLPIGTSKKTAEPVQNAGWVARLASGKPDLDGTKAGTGKARMTARLESVMLTLNRLDEEALRRRASFYRANVDADGHLPDAKGPLRRNVAAQ